MEERVLEYANYVLNTGKTLREAAKDLGLSKSQLHRILNYKLKDIDNELYLEIKTLFSEHNKYRHIKGGMATKLKYKKTLIIESDS